MEEESMSDWKTENPLKPTNIMEDSMSNWITKGADIEGVGTVNRYTLHIFGKIFNLNFCS